VASGHSSDAFPETWTSAIAAMVSAIKQGRPGDAFVAAIELCGAELAQHFPPGELNPNELGGRDLSSETKPPLP
jgi:putative membrane protein